MNIYKAVVLIILFVMVYCAAVQAESVDKIIAVVNEEIITLNEFNTAFEPYRKRIEETYRGNDKDGVIKETKAAFLGRLIDNLLIEQEAKKSGASIKIKDEEVMGALKDMLAKQNVKLEDFLKKLEKEGDSLESVKDELRGQLMRMRLMRWEIRSKIMVSDQEIGDFYNQHREEYEGKEAVRIKQILLMIPQNADRATKIKIKEDARQIQKKALSGESFDLLAAKYSQGPGADQGGDIGFIERGVTIPELEKAAFSLLVDQVSPVIESSLGFHIIKVVEKRGAGLKPIAAVREEIKTKLEDVKLEKKYDEWISSVRKKSFIEIR